MKIAGLTYKKKSVILMNHYLTLWAESYNPKRAYHKMFDYKNTFYEEVMPHINLSGISNIDGRSKKINGKWVFPSARKLSIEAEDFITKKQQEIENLRKEIDEYLNNHFMEWDFVTIEDVLQFRDPNKTDSEQEQKYQAYIKKVIKQLDMTKTELKKEVV
jgi:hypothetical protein